MSSGLQHDAETLQRRKRLSRAWAGVVVVWSLVRTAIVWAAVGDYGLNPWIYFALDLGAAIVDAFTTPRMVLNFIDDHYRLAVKWALISLGVFIIPDLYIFLGTRECQGYVEPCAFDDGTGFYDDYGELSMGFQFHGFNYPDETGREQLGVRLWNARMENGIIRFPRPELFKEGDPAYPLRIVREGVKPKLFVRGENAAFLEDEPELEDLGAEEDGI